MSFASKGVWVMVCKSLRTELVDEKSYRISGFMGYLGYGLWECQLYFFREKRSGKRIQCDWSKDGGRSKYGAMTVVPWGPSTRELVVQNLSRSAAALDQIGFGESVTVR